MEQDRYALTYRSEETRQVMGWIKAGSSGCLVGLRGAGKSNFIRFLLREDVQRHYLGQDVLGDGLIPSASASGTIAPPLHSHDAASFVLVLVDLLALTELTEYAVYELMLDRLLRQLPLPGTAAGLVVELKSQQQAITHARDPLVARRAVEQCVDALCLQFRRIVVFLDEFDAVFHALDPSLFRCLRAIRDAHKEQVSYNVVVAVGLAYLRDDLQLVDPFYRLVTRNVCGLGPYGDQDARQMVRYLAARRSIVLSERDIVRLLEYSGGHAGLLKAMLSLLWDVHYQGDLERLSAAFAAEPAVQAECRKVWASLPQDQQAALCAVVNAAPADPLVLRHLQLTGLVRGGHARAALFSPVFAGFVRQQAAPILQETFVRRSPPLVRIEGRLIENLSELEFDVLCYLYEHRGRVCIKDELVENVYRRQYDSLDGGATDQALQTLISRVRAKIEPDRRRPRYVVTVRDQGYKFA